MAAHFLYANRDHARSYQNILDKLITIELLYGSMPTPKRDMIISNAELFSEKISSHDVDTC
jgi:hypothetical protein